MKKRFIENTDISFYENKTDEAKDILDRIINFIHGCDTKASIVLGVIGVSLGLLLSDTYIKFIYHYLLEHHKETKCIIFIIVTSLIIVLLFFGIFKLISVLVAKCKPTKNDSLVYFTDIAQNKTLEDFRTKFINTSEKDIFLDLINDIYANSKICRKKYINYNTGLICVCLSALLLLSDIIVFTILR